VKRSPRTLLATIGFALLLGSCSEADLPERSVQRDDCLRDVRLDQLPQALKRCDQVVQRFPEDPLPRNERSLLLALSGDDKGACREINTAHALLQRSKTKDIDPLLVSELHVRRRSCQVKA